MLQEAAATSNSGASRRAAQRAPRPGTLAETGLPPLYLADLLAKHLLEQGVLDLHQLGCKSALAGSVVQEVCRFLREEGRVEVRGQGTGGALRFGLTDRGRALAQEAFNRDGYSGKAPVTLEEYSTRVREQALSKQGTRRDAMMAAFADTVMGPALLDQLGPGLHSGRAIFIHGHAGTGKSYIARRLMRLLQGEVLVPHAILVGGKTIRCYDPAVHQTLEDPADTLPTVQLYLEQGHDPRYVRCHRPCVVTGGELTMERLELQYDATSHIHLAPVQLLANNGMLVIDDLGRQRMSPTELLNRWIVPLEERCDFLSLANGYHFSVPFEVALVFSTNLDPLSLADAAFLRRIGYKIHFAPLEREAYLAIWQQECQAQGLPFEQALADFTIDELHVRDRVPLLACHPRDILSLAHDQLDYQGLSTPDRKTLSWAWRTYFGDFRDAANAADRNAADNRRD